MEFNDVINLIREEKYYQDMLWDNDHDHSVGDWIIFIEQCLAKAKVNLYNEDKKESMAQIRNIAALCVSAMSHIPTPSRRDQ